MWATRRVAGQAGRAASDQRRKLFSEAFDCFAARIVSRHPQHEFTGRLIFSPEPGTRHAAAEAEQFHVSPSKLIAGKFAAVENNPAADFGFQPGDIVREVNGTTIDTAAALELAAQTDTRWWRFTVERGGQILRQVLRY